MNRYEFEHDASASHGSAAIMASPYVTWSNLPATEVERSPMPPACHHEPSPRPGTRVRRRANIVPPYSPVSHAPVAPPLLTYRGGPLLTDVEVFSLYWGEAWTSTPLQRLAARLQDFLTFALASPLVGQLAEYSVPGHHIGTGHVIGSRIVASGGSASSVSDAGIQLFVREQIARRDGVPSPTPHSLYCVYLPPGMAVSMEGMQSCQAFCGYHAMMYDRIAYLVVTYPSCPGCVCTFNTFDAMTATTSHALCEAITDPLPGKGWYDDVNGEIGDVAPWKTRRLGGYRVQLQWSNRARGCV
jgi:hypothetical protein